MIRSGLPAVLGMLAIVAMTLLSAGHPAFAADAGMLLPGDPALIHLITVEQALLDLTNTDRVANGLQPLEFDPDSLSIARTRAESQLGAPSLSHYDADGHLIFARLLSDANLSYGLAGENLARASSDDTSVTTRVEQALMQSPTHRRNILERTFKRVAIGAATDASGWISFAEVYRD
jgi:uncharacterized protein YkwD